MSYPGNGELSREIQERVISTFEHTLQLVEQSSRDEALLGCDFILRLDPLFEPARVLQDRLRRTEGAVHDLEVGDLAAVSESALRGPDEVSAAAGAAVSRPRPGSREEADGPESPSVEELQDALARHLDQRQLEEAIELARRHQETVAMDPLLQRTVEAAASRLEAEPYVESFLDAARGAMGEGDHARAENQLDKARTLDPTHPGIAALQAMLAGGARASAAAPARSATGEDSFAGLDDDLGSLAGEDDLSDLGLDFDQELDDGLAFAFDDDAEAGRTAPTVADEDPDRRIEELLAEGQTAFGAADYQGAIDAWSRIFLIDIDHAEANQRIEQARKLKAESDRAVEEILHDGLRCLEAEDPQAARSYFEEVLRRQPDHVEAREALHKLDSVPEAGEASAATRADQEEEITETLERPLAATGPAAASRPSPPRRRSPSARFLAIGGVVLILAGAGAWYLIGHWDVMFPNSTPETPAARARSIDPIERARRLNEEGKIQEAIAQLRRLPPASPDYAEAQALVAQWESVPAEGEAEGSIPSAEDSAHRDELLAEARRARSSGRLIEALSLVEQAGAIAPLSGDDRALAEAIDDEIAPLRPQLELFRDGDWEYALPDLWLLYDAEPGNRDVRRLIVDSYYNLGVRDLQRGFPAAAAKKFEEALALAPGDDQIERLRGFAETYEERSEDLLYRIFVKYLPFRS